MQAATQSIPGRRSKSPAKSTLQSGKEVLLNVMRKPKPTYLASLFPKPITLPHQVFHFNLSHLWKQYVKKRANLTNTVNIISSWKIYKCKDLNACCALWITSEWTLKAHSMILQAVAVLEPTTSYSFSQLRTLIQMVSTNCFVVQNLLLNHS